MTAKSNLSSVLVYSALLFFAFFFLLEAACSVPPGVPKAVCAVIDVACGFVTVRYTGPDGRVHEEEVPADQIVQAAKTYAAKKASTP